MSPVATKPSLMIAAMCALTCVLPTRSFALPKGSGSHPCQCMCYVTLGNGTTTSVYESFNLPNQYVCGSAVNMVCNVSDPTTGGVRQGKMEGCGDIVAHATPLPFRPPVTNPIGILPTR